MKISHILPTDLLYLLNNQDFYMCLANIAIKNSDYLNYYKQKSIEGKFILLDNGAAEQDQMTLDIMYDIIKEIKPSEVVLNDKLFDREETIKQSNIALDFYKTKGYDKQFMFVAQGEDYGDWVLNFKEDIINKIHTIGIPKTIDKQWLGKYWRYNCCRYIASNYPDKYIHLLGCNEYINDIKVIKDDITTVRSIDTALTYIYAKANKNILYETKRPNEKMDFIKSTLTNLDLLKTNITLFNKTLK